ncbi:MAG: glycine cleavage system protein GcvH [Candidatus Thermoplasmatota archaeon]|jgi:glycine cleavage system H protein|nr:glycine cleavage system protein GcvH [Candidatus Thermoplasmatota archaeon]
MIVKDGLYYTKTHEWLKVDGDIASIGITDFAQNQMSDIVYVDFPKVGATIKAGEIVGTVESVKSAEDFYSPITGKVVEVNKSLEKTPEDINNKPYDSWIVKLKMSNSAEISNLLKKEAYEKLTK